MSTQSLSALARAHETRSARAALKRQLAQGELSLAAALRHPMAQGMRVWDVLCAQRRWGPYKAREAMKAAGVLESRRCEHLRSSQLESLCNENGRTG